MVIGLPQARFDIVGMHGNIMIGEGDSKVPYMGEEIGHDHSEHAVQFGALFGGCHEIDWDDSIIGRSTALKMSWSFSPSLTRLC